MACCTKAVAIILPVIIAYWMFSGVKFDPESIRSKRVLVTGASSGIGEKIAYKYAQLGAKLVITARRQELLEKIAKKCKELGAEFVHPVPADMAIAEDREKVVSATKKQLGGLDFLILNHAYLHHGWWRATQDNMETLQTMMNVNFHSYVDITSKLLQELQESQGYIGVVSSVAGKVSAPGLSSYCANKHALQGFYASLRQELRAKNTGISVTLIVYGPVASEHVIRLNKEKPLSPVDFASIAGTTDDAADVLVRGVSAREYEVYFPALATLFYYANRIIPGYLEDFAGNNILEV